MTARTRRPSGQGPFGLPTATRPQSYRMAMAQRTTQAQLLPYSWSAIYAQRQSWNTGLADSHSGTACPCRRIRGSLTAEVTATAVHTQPTGLTVTTSHGKVETSDPGLYLN
jgi:hypothetical protein